jgi:hypothetical protein
MKRSYLLLMMISFSVAVKSQGYLSYKDTINKFSVVIPQGWRYGLVPGYPSIKLTASRIPATKSDTAKLSFNLNILEEPNSTLEKAYKTLIKYLPEAKKFALLKEGEAEIDKKKFKWLLEEHQNEQANVLMESLVFVTHQKGKTYILTMSGFRWDFDKYLPLFNIIVGNFRLY